ncbi:glycosyltransferase [Caproicibacterium lactatifermentans]|jgi:glycosyltransferase involved in cell wall biosynthesis|uniref:glycosyltransferase n=1 Tax=Caproicibacterium lactatifermentans TaxID=2666138 RepID=UPI003D8AD3E5
MELMYLTFQEDALLYVGVTRKIRSQVHAFQQLGYHVTYSLWKGCEYRFVTENGTQIKKLTGGSGMMHQLADAAKEYLSQHSFDVLYMRLDRISFDVLEICRITRRNGTRRIIIELPNYPYIADYISSVDHVHPLTKRVSAKAHVLAFAAEDRLSALGLKGLVDAVALIGNPSDHFFGVKAINISNGIDVNAMKPVPLKSSPDEIVLIGVAGTLWWQAYDRILEGMYRYKKAEPHRKPHIRFIMVGGDPKEMPDFRAQIRKYGLQEDVECPGFKTGKELENLYARADLGVSKLGCYRRGLQACSSLKAREYCAQGLPFIYTCEDSLEKENSAFALQVPNDPSPVDMNMVVKFVLNCRQHPEITAQERQFAMDHFDWKMIMEKVLRFAGVADDSNHKEDPHQ